MIRIKQLIQINTVVLQRLLNISKQTQLKLLYAIVVIVIGGLIMFVLGKIIERTILKRVDEKRKQTLLGALKQVIKYLVIFIAMLIILNIFGVSQTLVLVLSSVGTLALGIGARTFVADVMSGISILFDQKMAVGDSVIIAGKSGKVEMIGLRITKIRDELEGGLSIIPNNEIKIITNLSGDKRQAVIHLPIAYHEDLETIYALLEAAAKHYKSAFTDVKEPIIKGITAYEEHAVLVRIVCAAPATVIYSVEREMRQYFIGQLREAGVSMILKNKVWHIEKIESDNVVASVEKVAT